VKSSAYSGVTAETYEGVTFFTDPERRIGDDREMNVLVTISVLNDDGDEVGESSASAETPEDAFALARGDLELEEDD